MRPARKSTLPNAYQSRSNSLRHHGRVTKEDVRAASLRRWDGRARVTTDWFNLLHEPELCFADGDLLIYLREPGQSSHGPAFRVHKAQLKERRFDFLLDKCIDRPPIHPGTKCTLSTCHGCDIHPPPSELYIPAPSNSGLDSIFDHHITTRNFFAWLYNIPLTGRALGRSLVTLKERIDYYKPNDAANVLLEVISFAEAQSYLDFRECVDHALAALLFAECLQIEDLWVDAFTHCVGMYERGLNDSLEYWAISYETRLLIDNAQQEIQSRIESVRRSVCDFFENDLSGNFLGFSPAARDHFDRFRSWLHSYHIEQHGFWPPHGFETEAVEHNIYTSMYSEFRNLYHHLVDPDSSRGITDLHLQDSGGICTIQNVQAFDLRRGYESLPKTMPMLPREPDQDSKLPGAQRRKSWNPLVKRKSDRAKRKALRAQALIAASNRDWMIMECPLVRKYSEFESETIMDDSETISMVDGRKVRWILIYAILQRLISVMQTPKQVRNADGLTYLLCCTTPKLMPWQLAPKTKGNPSQQEQASIIEPDTQYEHSSTETVDAVSKPSSSISKQIKDMRRQSLPARVSSLTISISNRPATSRSTSLRRFIPRRESFRGDVSPGPRSPGFCEILVQGYGNGLNEIDPISPTTADSASVNTEADETPRAYTPSIAAAKLHGASSGRDSRSAIVEKVPELTPASSPSVSRESSNASSNSQWSKASPYPASEANLTARVSVQGKPQASLPDLSKLILGGKTLPGRHGRPPSADLNHVIDEGGLVRTVHFNTQMWDELLGDVRQD